LPPVAVFKYPAEFILNVADAPKIKVRAEKVALECEKSYKLINDELKAAT
jgi:hypothetical protein